MMTAQRERLTRAEAAQRASVHGRKGVHIRTIDRWLARGLLTRYKTRLGHVRIDADELRALTEETNR